MNPLITEPMTIPASSGAVSGSDRGAVSPSKRPRKPPRSRPNSHFSIAPSRREDILPTVLLPQRGQSFEPPRKKPRSRERRRRPLQAGGDEQRDPHGQVGEHQGDGGA